MVEPVHVAGAPAQPLLIYDGECNFCCFWIAKWQTITGVAVQYLPFQDPTVAVRFPELPRSRFETAVQLIEPDGRVFGGAEAVYRSLAYNPRARWLLLAYEKVPGVAVASEVVYGLIARHRSAFSLLTRALLGPSPEALDYRLVRALFLRGIGLVYLAAFLSIWVQLNGLIGRNGILPAAQFMHDAGQYFDAQQFGAARYHLLPTWCWLGASDAFLHALCGAGVVAAILLIVGVAPALSTFALWTLYLSFMAIGREFLSFQWDALLVEAGFLAIWFAPLRWWPRGLGETPVARIPLWLLRWLLFRLMFESGCVKLLSGDATWRQLAALDVHYQTQPLPTWIAWYAHHASPRLNHACVGVLFGIELALPFFIFGPRRLRLVACVGFIVLQVWILLTGNYAFFNYLTILLTVVLFDDKLLRRLVPPRWRGSSAPAPAVPAAIPNEQHAPRRAGVWPAAITVPLAVLIVVVSATQLAGMFRSTPFWFRPAEAVARWISPFRIVNSYGLFAVMTTTRPEIIVEGSNDRQTWRPYEFKYKPGALDRRPRFVAPHQPRLDWQMWFAALGTPQQNPWFVNFCVRLLQGTPEVLALLAANPFPDAPPIYIRAVVYEYRFCSPTLRRQGAWWQRERVGTYLPPISLRNGNRPGLDVDVPGP